MTAFSDESPFAISKTLIISPGNKVTVNVTNTQNNAEKVKITINAAAGSFTGSFVHPGTPTPITFKDDLGRIRPRPPAEKKP